MIANVLYYQDSKQFKKSQYEVSIIRHLENIIDEVFSTQRVYRWHYENGQTLWCDVTIDDKKHGRYELNLKTNKIEFFIFWKHSNMVGDGWFSKKSRVIGETPTHYTVVYNEETGQTSDMV